MKIRELRYLLFVCLVLGLAPRGAVGQITYTWHQIGSLPEEGSCCYFWNETTGVTATQTAFFYTRDGATWQPSAVISNATQIYSIRTFDLKTLYAGVVTIDSDEIWISRDSGKVWNMIISQPKTFNPVDVFWSYPFNTPVLKGTRVARMDQIHLVASDDDSKLAPQFSNDGGQTWQNGAFSSFGYSSGGFGVYADTINKIYYDCGEAGQHGAQVFESFDFGQTWSEIPPMPDVDEWIDDIEGSFGKLYFESDTAIFMSSNGGASWSDIGGPSRILDKSDYYDWDNVSFAAFGCAGLTVACFDENGGVWLGVGTPPYPIHSSIPVPVQECDSTIISVTIDSGFGMGRSVFVSQDDGNSGVFNIIGPAILNGHGNLEFSLLFLAHDTLAHSDTLWFSTVGDGPCDPISHIITVQAVRTSAFASASNDTVDCSATLSQISITNPEGCDLLHITNISLSTQNISVIPFDSLISSYGSISLDCSPNGASGTANYPIHLQGYSEYSNAPFDTTIFVQVTSKHIPSKLESPNFIDLGNLEPCNALDTMLILQNSGCDTITYSLDQPVLTSGWSVTPSSGQRILLPYASDTVEVHFSAIPPGAYNLGLRYTWTALDSGVDTIDFKAIVKTSQPILSTPTTTFNFASRTDCDNDTTIEIIFTNPGCDSILITNEHFTSIGALQLTNPVDTIIPKGGEFAVDIYLNSKDTGIFSQDLSLHLSRADSSLGYDTTVHFSVTIARGKATLQSLVNAIDVGQTYICEERDTFVAIQNTGCDSVCISDISFSSSGFTLANGTLTSICLGPGDWDTIQLLTQIDTNGRISVNSDSLIVISTSEPPLGVIPLSREIDYPLVWQLAMSPPDSSFAGQELTYELIQRNKLPAGFTSVDVTLTYDDDLLKCEGATETSVVDIGHKRTADGFAHETFHIAPVVVDSLIAHLLFYPYVARNSSTAISIDSVFFSSSLPEPIDCIASFNPSSTEFTLRQYCGDAELEQFLKNGQISVSAIEPNPATDEVRIGYSNITNESFPATLTIEDILGRATVQEPIVLIPGFSNSESVSVSGLPQGAYLLRVSGSGLESSKSFIKE